MPGPGRRSTSRNSTSGSATRTAPFLSASARSLTSASLHLSSPRLVLILVHRDDIYLLFGTSNTRLNAAERIVADELTSRWAAFAYTGTPNALGYHRWTPVSGPKLLNLLTFGAGANGASTIRQTYKVAECAVGSGLWGRAAPFDSQA